MTLIKESVTLEFSSNSFSMTGNLYVDQELMLVDMEEGDVEHLSVNLDSYGLITRPGFFWIKDWSEHAGLAQSLIDAGVAEYEQEFMVGPFKSRAVEVRMI